MKLAIGRALRERGSPPTKPTFDELKARYKNVDRETVVQQTQKMGHKPDSAQVKRVREASQEDLSALMAQMMLVND